MDALVEPLVARTRWAFQRPAELRVGVRALEDLLAGLATHCQSPGGHVLGHIKAYAPLPAGGWDAVAGRLQRWHAAGRLRTEDPDAAADRFTHPSRGGLCEQTLLGRRARSPGPKAIEAAVVPAVRDFLQGVTRR